MLSFINVYIYNLLNYLLNLFQLLKFLKNVNKKKTNFGI